MDASGYVRVAWGACALPELFCSVFVDAGGLDNAIDAKRRYETYCSDDQNFNDFSHCRLLTL